MTEIVRQHSIKKTKDSNFILLRSSLRSCSAAPSRVCWMLYWWRSSSSRLLPATTLMGVLHFGEFRALDPHVIKHVHGAGADRRLSLMTGQGQSFPVG